MQRPVRRLPGTRDLLGDAFLDKVAVEHALESVIAAWGYEKIETPVLEESDLFLRKSGGELAARLYSVDDPGGARAALRPEFTASVIRVLISFDDLPPTPIRWRYSGPVFRHSALDVGAEGRQVTQVGAELLGAAGPLADIEGVVVACEALIATGLRDAVVTLGHLGVLAALLGQFGLSDRAEGFLLSRLGLLRDPAHGPEALLEEARVMQLLPDPAVTAGSAQGDDLPSGIDPVLAKRVVQQMIRSLEPSWIGHRGMEEVEERLLGKLLEVEDPARFEMAIRFLAELGEIRGEGVAILDDLTAAAERFGLDTGPLQPLRDLVPFLFDLPEMRGVKQIWDFGFAPGLAYYSGLVFEFSHPRVIGRPLGAGGRYDGLVRALGGRDLPALGFAFSVEAVEAARVAEGLPAASGVTPGLSAVVVPRRWADSGAALAEARRIRAGANGAAVALYPKAGAIDAAREFALARGAPTFVIVGPDGNHSVELKGYPR
ncbi:MAG: ATP phosphoribosyltransferase regulatory subunit [Chloroflexi bacterium]|nr:ATP phosphoribosyltransferase regulatory subunit [Chloroflexota bacterium]